MTIDRRDFLKLSAGAAGTTILAPSGLGGVPIRGGSRPALGGAIPHGPLTFPSAEYASRRALFMDQIPDGIAVFLGSSSGRQNNEIRYFSGVEIPRTTLIIDGTRRESTLFYSTRESYLRGENLSPELALRPLESTGVEAYFPADEFSSVFSELMTRVEVLYTAFDSEVAEAEVSTRSEWDGRPTRRRRFVEVLEDRFPAVEVRDCSETIWEQRRFKTPAEIDAIRQAGRIGASAMIEVMNAGRPGLYEYELSSLYEYTCKKQGARELAFDTIISSAENHTYLHYAQYNRLLEDGDFLVVDAGPKWQDYCMDTTISFPINGRFSPRQREIYQACLEISKGCLARYRPGLTGFDIGEQVRDELDGKGYAHER